MFSKNVFLNFFDYTQTMINIFLTQYFKKKTVIY
jgi:hypothetical protein